MQRRLKPALAVVDNSPRDHQTKKRKPQKPHKTRTTHCGPLEMPKSDQEVASKRPAKHLESSAISAGVNRGMSFRINAFLCFKPPELCRLEPFKVSKPVSLSISTLNTQCGRPVSQNPL